MVRDLRTHISGGGHHAATADCNTNAFSSHPGPLPDVPHIFFHLPHHISTMSTGKKDVYLVIGGSGFLGRHIVEALLARGDSVSVFDIVQRHHDVPFYSGDISEEEQVSDALRKVRFIVPCDC